MHRCLLALAFVAVAVAGQAAVVFSDGFETGDLSQWPTLVADGTNPITVVTAGPTNYVHSGTYAAFVDGNTSNSDRVGVTIGDQDPTGPVTLTFWMYDSQGPALGGGRQYMELRAYDGSNLQGLWALGKYNSGTNYVGTKYQARVLNDVAWITLTDGPDRSVGWHEMKIEIAADGSLFYIDGILSGSYARGTTAPVDTVVLGSGLSSNLHPVWFDDVTVEAVPEPATLAALGLGVAALLRRRRKN